MHANIHSFAKLLNCLLIFLCVCFWDTVVKEVQKERVPNGSRPTSSTLAKTQEIILSTRLLCQWSNQRVKEELKHSVMLRGNRLMKDPFRHLILEGGSYAMLRCAKSFCFFKHIHYFIYRVKYNAQSV